MKNFKSVVHREMIVYVGKVVMIFLIVFLSDVALGNASELVV